MGVGEHVHVFFTGIVCTSDRMCERVYERVRVIICVRVFYHALCENVD